MWRDMVTYWGWGPTGRRATPVHLAPPSKRTLGFATVIPDAGEFFSLLVEVYDDGIHHAWLNEDKIRHYRAQGWLVVMPSDIPIRTLRRTGAVQYAPLFSQRKE